MKKIQIISDISDESYAKFSAELAEYETNKKHRGPVIVELSSPGGNAYDALAFWARIKNSPKDIHIYAFGLIASAAVLVLAAGDKRIMSKTAWVMVHEDSVQDLTANVTEMEKFSKHARDLENQWNDLLESATTTDAGVWEMLHKDTTYLSSDQCKEFGLIDEEML